MPLRILVLASHTDDGEFAAGQGIVDLLSNCGSQSATILRAGGQP
jgi:hypothetical protein